MTVFDPSFDLRLLRSFAAVAEELHFGHAADRLMIAQPALSRQIARLEEQLGTKLLDRSTREVTLTAAGETFIAATNDILACAARAVAAVKAEHDELTVVVSDSAGPQVRQAITTFMAAHPEIVLRMRTSHEIGTSALASGEAGATVDLLEVLAPTLCYAPCVRVRAGVACPASHRIAQQASVTWRDLAGERVIVAPKEYPPSYNTLVRSHLEAADVCVEEVEAPPVSTSMMAAYIIGGRLGLHVCPRHFHEPLPPDLVWVPFEPPVRFEFGVTWHRDEDRESVKRFVRWMSASARR